MATIRKRGKTYQTDYFDPNGKCIRKSFKKKKDAQAELGKRVDSVKTSFNAAVRRAGIVDFRFHDLRHTFASQLLMKGGILKDVQELLGHKTMTMTMTLRYTHLTQEHKRKAVNLLNGLTGNCVTKLSQKVISVK